MSERSAPSVFYPPGGILIWILICLELLTYGLAIAALVYYGSAEREAFHHDSQLLSRPMATANTLLLLTSGYLIARAVHFFRQGDSERSKRLISLSMLFGLGFLILKSIEYSMKLNAGLVIDYSNFFMFYWLLTGFHWVHVFVGMIILYFIRLSISKKGKDASLEDVEAAAAFWHMCDLIWLILFPVLYLLF